MVSYYFPPSGGVAVQRVLKFTKYLPDNGWQVSVLAAKGGGGRWPYVDETLMAEVPPSTHVFRTIAPDPSTVKQALTRRKRPSNNSPSGGSQSSRPSLGRRLTGAISSYCLLPDDEIGWFPFAVARGLEAMARERVDVIWATAPQFTAHLVALSLAKLTRKPLVVDFRDLWTQSYIRQRPPVPHKINELMERLVLQHSDRVTVVSDGMAKLLYSKVPSLDPRKLTTITNGYDPSDFDKIAPAPSGPKLRIAFVGTFYPPGCSQPFLSALSELSAEDRQHIEVVFAGALDPVDTSLVKKLGLDDVVRLLPFVPYGESLRLQREADVLLLLFGVFAGSEAHLTGKLFDYMGARRTILAIVPPDSPAARVVSGSGIGIVVPPEDVPAIKQHLHAFLHQKHAGTLELDPNTLEGIRKYDRRELTRQLADVLATVLRQKVKGE